MIYYKRLINSNVVLVGTSESLAETDIEITKEEYDSLKASIEAKATHIVITEEA